MKKYVLTIALVLIVARARADDASFGPQRGVLLLRNGSVLEGNILRSGDRYDVGLQDGELRVRVSEVEFAGRTLEECYQHRRGGIAFDEVQGRLDLVEWCLRHQLHVEAGRELKDALAVDPSHPKIAIVERRLKLALEGPPATPAREPTRIDMATPEELDQMVRSMPAGTVERFTNTVQPMLLNQCSTASCHGPASPTPLRLTRVSAGRTQSRRATQRNLHAVLATIDHEQPDASPLLLMPTRPHGASRTAVFTSQKAIQYKQLVDWAYSVSNKTQVKRPIDDTASEEWPFAGKPKKNRKNKDESLSQSPTIAAKYLDQTVPSGGEVQQQSDTDVKPAAAQESADEPSDSAEKDVSTINPRQPQRLGRRRYAGQTPDRSTPKRGELPKEDEPADPFDPEQFNKQFLGK